MSRRNNRDISVDRFRAEIAPFILKEIEGLRRTVCRARFPLNTPEWKASWAFLGSIDEFVGVLCGYPKIFHYRGSTPTEKPVGPVETYSEEWWLRKIEAARSME